MLCAWGKAIWRGDDSCGGWKGASLLQGAGPASVVLISLADPWEERINLATPRCCWSRGLERCVAGGEPLPAGVAWAREALREVRVMLPAPQQLFLQNLKAVINQVLITFEYLMADYNYFFIIF